MNAAMACLDGARARVCARSPARTHTRTCAHNHTHLAHSHTHSPHTHTHTHTPTHTHTHIAHTHLVVNSRIQSQHARMPLHTRVLEAFQAWPRARTGMLATSACAQARRHAA